MDWNTILYRLKALNTYRELLKEPVMAAAVELMDCIARADEAGAMAAWGELHFQMGKAGVPQLGAWLNEALLHSDAPWPRAVAEGQTDPFLDACAAFDLETLSALAALNPLELRTDASAFLSPKAQEALRRMPAPGPAGGLLYPSAQEWKEYYKTHGCGLFARYRAFLWENGRLLPIEKPDTPAQADLIGYRRQRAQVEDNTYALLSGKPVNNVLLFGDSGTGKSATVKSLLGLPNTEDLRLIEVEKNSVHQLPKLIRSLAGHRQKFILFIDDLAFDQDDRTYGVLKTILEGGLEPRPDNVAIYATSNRRNLVRQTFSDRAGDEVDRDETIQEKTALADRFGLRIPYLGLAKAEFLELVEHLATQGGSSLPREELLALAVRWDARHPGRSPRSARQFIASLGI